jgi:hypothetical protein
MRQYKNHTRASAKGVQGTGTEVLIIPAENIATWPRTKYEKNLGTNGYTPALGDKVTFDEAFTYKTVNSVAAKFSRIKIVFDTGKPMYESIGDKGFKALENKLQGKVSNAFDPAWLELVQEITDSEGDIVLIDLPELDAYGVFGNNLKPIEVSFKGDKGLKAGDTNATEIEIADSNGLIMKLYPKSLGVTVVAD